MCVCALEAHCSVPLRMLTRFFLQVLLRIKESEIQYLEQEIHSLKDELQSALRVRDPDSNPDP